MFVLRFKRLKRVVVLGFRGMVMETDQQKIQYVVNEEYHSL